MSGMDRSAIVVPTRNRADLLIGLLENVSTTLSPTTIIVVDSSDDSEARQLWRNWAGQAGKVTHFISSHPGAGHQKNLGLRLAKSLETVDTVFFLDDDIRVQAGYFEEALRLMLDPKVHCLGGYDEQMPSTPSSRFRRLLGFAGEPSKFSLLSNGLTTYGCPERHLEVADWVPGGMMAVRLSKVEIEFNDEALIYGDDLEFQLANFNCDHTFVSHALKVRHLQGQGNKERESRRHENYAHFRWSLTWHPRVRRESVIAGSFVSMLASAAPGPWFNFARLIGEARFLAKVILGLSQTRKRELVQGDETVISYSPTRASFVREVPLHFA